MKFPPTSFNLVLELPRNRVPGKRPAAVFCAGRASCAVASRLGWMGYQIFF